MKAYELAKAEIGTVEWTKGDNPKVVAYFKDSGNAGVKDDATAWCAAFVGAMLKRAGMKGTGKLNARSYLEWGVPVERKDAKPGDIVVFKRGNSSWQGHVAFFVKDKGEQIVVLGGNQSDAVNEKPYSASQLLGIRRMSPPLTRPAPHVNETPKIEHVQNVQNAQNVQPPMERKGDSKSPNPLAWVAAALALAVGGAAAVFDDFRAWVEGWF